MKKVIDFLNTPKGQIILYLINIGCLAIIIFTFNFGGDLLINILISTFLGFIIYGNAIKVNYKKMKQQSK